MKKKSLGILGKLILVFSLLLIMVSGIITTINNIRQQQTLVSKEETTLSNGASMIATQINTSLQAKVDLLETLVGRPELSQYEVGSSELTTFVNTEGKKLGFRNAFYVDSNKNIYLSSGAIDDGSKDDAVVQAFKGNVAFSEPLYREDSQITLMNIVVPVMDANNKVIGAVIGTQDVTDFSAVIDDVGYTSFIMSSQQQILAHTNRDMLNTSALEQEVQDQITENTAKNEQAQSRLFADENGFVKWTLEVDGSSQYMGYAAIPLTGWRVAILEPTTKINTEILKQTQNSVFVSVVLIVIGVILVGIICKKITNDIKGISNQLIILADGDFTVDMDRKIMKSRDELGVAAQATEQMKSAISEILSMLQQNIMELEDKSQQLGLVSNETQQSVGGIAHATHEMSVGVQDQTNDLVNILEVVNAFGDKIQGVVDRIAAVQDQTQMVGNEVTNGNENAKNLSASVGNVTDSFQQFSAKIDQLSTNIQNITDITMIINNIAEQTSLLSLNASIEAARAGEAGKGFSVVAEEIRKLADQCKTSADDINAMIAHVAEETGTLISQSNGLSEELNGQLSSISDTVSSYETMSDTIYQMISNISDISDQVVEIGQDKNNIITRVENVTAVGEEITASTEEISANAEMVKTSADKVESSAAALSVISDEIDKQISKFKIKK